MEIIGIAIKLIPIAVIACVIYKIISRSNELELEYERLENPQGDDGNGKEEDQV